MTIDTERENERRMDKVYDRIVESIHMQPRDIKKYAFKALSWIGYATRTFTVQELLVAISVEAKQYQLNDGDMLGLEDLLDICNGLIIADGRDVRLVHFSVRNYLDRHQVIPEDAKEMYRAIVCCTYLSFDSFQDSFGHFQYYAANNLTFHLSKVERRHYSETTGAVLKLLEGKGHRLFYCRANHKLRRLTEISRLNLACAIGYEDAVRTLLKDGGVDVNAEDTTYLLTSLSWALVMGHEAVAKRLVGEDRVDRNYKDIMGRRPLTLAIWQKNKENVQLLLEKGVEVNYTFIMVSQSSHIRPQC